MTFFWVLLGIALFLWVNMVGLGFYSLLLAKSEATKVVAEAVAKELEDEEGLAEAMAGIGFRR